MTLLTATSAFGLREKTPEFSSTVLPAPAVYTTPLTITKSNSQVRNKYFDKSNLFKTFSEALDQFCSDARLMVSIALDRLTGLCQH